jgi:hypothetical protein
MTDQTVIPFRKCVNPKHYVVSTCLNYPQIEYLLVGLRERGSRENGVENPVEAFVAIPKSESEGIGHDTLIDAEISYNETIRCPMTARKIPVLKRFEAIKPCPSETLRIVLNPYS